MSEDKKTTEAGPGEGAPAEKEVAPKVAAPAPKPEAAPAPTPAPEAAPAPEAVKEAVKKEKPSNCASCNKSIRKKQYYYRNGKYYCTKTCWKNTLKKQEEKAA